MIKAKFSLVVTVLLALLCGQATADPIGSTLISITPVGGGLFDWAYTLNLSGPPPATSVTEQVSVAAGDSFTILDFGFFAGLIAFPVGWTPTLELTSAGAYTVSGFTDSAAVLNARFNFTAGGPLVGPLDPGPFIIRSTTSVPVAGQFVAKFEQATPSNPGVFTAQQSFGGGLQGFGGPPGAGYVPSPGGPTVPFPEPWNGISVIATLVPVGMLYLALRRRKTDESAKA